jgi:hypothetical protein
VWGHGVLLVCTEYSVLYSEIALSGKPFGIGHVYIYIFCLEWLILWPPRILIFPPGTPCTLIHLCICFHAGPYNCTQSLSKNTENIVGILWRIPGVCIETRLRVPVLRNIVSILDRGKRFFSFLSRADWLRSEPSLFYSQNLGLVLRR